MTHPMLEKVARAIFRAGFHPNEEDARVQHCWNEWPADRRASFTKARAAVQALMEPDASMNGPGANAYIVSALGEVEDAPRYIFQAMLRPLVEGGGE